jgi:F-type H+-transporting ATPase subunit a
VKKLFTTRNVIILIGIVLLFVVSRLLGLQVGVPEVSIKAEPIFSIGSFQVTNSLFTAWLVMIVLIVLSWAATRRMPKDYSTASNADLVPSGLQNAIEMVVEGFYRLVKDMSGAWTSRFFPIVMTIFLFVIAANWLSLLPGFGSIGILHPAEGAAGVTHPVLTPIFRSPSADLNFTIALALVAVVLTQYFGARALKRGYFHRFFDFSGFKDGVLVGIAQTFAGLLELMGEFTKIISFSFRLFGNIFAGEVLLAVMAFLVPYIITLPFLGLELFVGFIQAVVFMMLTLVFFINATSGHAVEATTGHEVAAHH